MGVDSDEDVIDARDHALIMGAIARGAPTLTSAELDEYLAASSSLAFWRKRAGKNQAMLAGEAGISQAFLAQIERGSQEGSAGVLAKLARALDVPIKELVVEATGPGGV